MKNQLRTSSSLDTRRDSEENRIGQSRLMPDQGILDATAGMWVNRAETGLEIAQMLRAAAERRAEVIWRV